jgi:large subunit ribosomal protein L1
MRGKKIASARQKVDKNQLLSVEDAVALMKEVKFAKFDETVEIAIKIVHKSYQNVRGFVTLPAGTGKKVRVLAICKGDKLEEAKESGADFFGAEEMIEKIQNEGWLDFDAVIATPDMMPKMSKIAPILGRRGMMPKPKAGTVTTDIKGIIKELKGGKVEYKADKTGVIHLGIGKSSFSNADIIANVKTLYAQVAKDKPSDAKGNYIKTVFLSSTMGPAIKINYKGVEK